MVKRLVLVLCALAIVVPSSARADHEISASYVSSMFVSATGEHLGIGAVRMDPPGRPLSITITDNAPIGFIAAHACQNVDGDTTHCESDEPNQLLCVRSGEPVTLDGFHDHEIHVFIYTAGTGVFSPACDSSLATTGTIAVGFEH